MHVKIKSFNLFTNKSSFLIYNKYSSGIGTDILKPTNIKVTLSQHDLTNKENGAYEMPIKSITVHPEYICNKPKDDIAILELDGNLQWSDSVSPACLPIASSDDGYQAIDDGLATVAGWGWTNEDSGKGGRAKILQKAKVNVIETEKCRAWYKSQGKKTKIQNTQICAGHEQGGVDACWVNSRIPDKYSAIYNVLNTLFVFRLIVVAH